ncbi:MAG: hypothetical protein ACREQP_20410 [Candidatus Binatia bacterium]
MAIEHKAWTAILRCRVCDRLFTLSGIPLDRIGIVNTDAQCPHCGAKSIFVSGENWEKESELHTIVDLEPDPTT